jgi:diguanylate cyclase (GGDEF)-like protein
VYRLYGDEFFVFIEEGNEESAFKYNLEVIDQLKKIKLQNNITISVKASMGYSIYNQGMDIDDFIKEADYDMYKNKINNKKENPVM